MERFHPHYTRFMKRWTILLVTLALVATATAQQPLSDDEMLSPPAAIKDLYPATANARKEIEAALTRARENQKHILLVFGANWCYDCHVLDRALHDGAAGKIIRKDFELVHINIGDDGEVNSDLAKRYQVSLAKGVPAVAVLKSDGSVLYSSNDGEFEAARRMIRRDLVSFLEKWREVR